MTRTIALRSNYSFNEFFEYTNLLVEILKHKSTRDCRVVSTIPWTLEVETSLETEEWDRLIWKYRDILANVPCPPRLGYELLRKDKV